MVEDQSSVNDSLGLRTLDRKWIQLSWYDGDCRQYRWFGTRAGSTFLLNFCDQRGEGHVDGVSRRTFMERIDAHRESSLVFLYDRERDRGTFQVSTDGDGDPCEVRER